MEEMKYEQLPLLEDEAQFTTQRRKRRDNLRGAQRRLASGPRVIRDDANFPNPVIHDDT